MTTPRKKPRLHGTHPEVSQLINDAQETAARELGEVVDTPQNRVRLASLIRHALLHQVALGWWARFGVAQREQMAGVVVRCESGNALVGESRIRIAYDFARTSMPGLLVDARPRNGARGPS